jgi:hypothetical protein
MDWGKQMAENQKMSRMALFQNYGYHQERVKRKSFVIDILTQKDIIDYNVKLQEPLRIDTLSDILIDSIITYDIRNNNSLETMCFLMDIEQFDIHLNTNLVNGSSTNNGMFNKLLIPNECRSGSWASHKSKKMNYVCTLNPCVLSSLNIRITDLNIPGSAMWSSDGRIIMELIISDK